MSQGTLEETYETVAGHVRAYDRFRGPIVSRTVRRIAWDSSVDGLRSMARFRPPQEPSRDLGTARRQTQRMIEVIRKVATPAERENPLFKHLVAEYPLESFAAELEASFPHANFPVLKEMHEFGATKGLWKKVLGGIFSFGALVLNMTPDSVIESLHWSVANFEFWTFVLTVGATVYIALLVFLHYWRDERARQSEGIGSMLEYLCIRSRRIAVSTPSSS